MPDLHALRAALLKTQKISTPAERELLLDWLLREAERSSVSVDFLNQHAGNLMVADAEFAKCFLAANVILRDGVGSRMALSLMGMESGMNMNGTDFIPLLIREFSSRYPKAPIAIFGTSEPWLKKGARQLAMGHDGALITADGFLRTGRYSAALQHCRHQPKLILLGMGMPRQELVATALRQGDIGPALIICGGAVIDFAAGRIPRAPLWMRNHGLEWCYRLTREPLRLFRRYVIGVPLFLGRILRLGRLPLRMR